MKSEIRNPKAEPNPTQCDGAKARLAGFTLIELLVVIAVMSILAAMLIPISGAVSRSRTRAKARTELEQVATGIELYKTKLGHYPPDNPGNPATNQLYFELLGTTFTNGIYTTLDGSAVVRATSLSTVFPSIPPVPGIGGIVNSSQGTTGDEGRSASAFLPGLKPAQMATINTSGGNQVRVLISSVPAPLNHLNTFCYVSSNPTNNPNSYDLWVDVLINGATNRISNWSKDVIINP
jgi:prepilin-type N-terminal cleavage/methylation domain-containing protein